MLDVCATKEILQCSVKKRYRNGRHRLVLGISTRISSTMKINGILNYMKYWLFKCWDVVASLL